MQRTLALILSLLPALALAAPELKGSPEELRQFLHPQEQTVSLSGDAEERAHTDEAIVSVVVTTERDELAAALQANAELRRKFADQLVHAGLDAEGIASAKFSASPQYGWFGKKPNSYKVVNRMTITVSNEQHMQAVAALSDRYDEAAFGEARFEHTEEEAYIIKAKQAALDDVMQQAAVYEKVLNLKLTPIRFHEGAVRPLPRRGVLLQEAAVTAAKSDSRAPESAPQQSPATFDEVIYRAEVMVEFRVEPAS